MIKQRYGDLASPERPRRLQYLDKVPEELAVNRDLQSVLSSITAAPTSERLRQIEAAIEALGAPKAPSLGEAALRTIAPFAGPVGAAVSVGGKVLGGLRGVADAMAARTGKAVSSVLGPVAKATEHSTPLATKVLAGLSYADRTDVDSKTPRLEQPERSATTTEAPTTLPALYKARTDEIKAQVQIAPDGSFQMRHDARMRLADKLSAVRAVDPRAADQFETIGARRIEWLASQIPRRPDLGGMQFDPRWQPSDMEMRAWARKAAAVEDPQAAFERIAAGN